MTGIAMVSPWVNEGPPWAGCDVCLSPEMHAQVQPLDGHLLYRYNGLYIL